MRSELSITCKVIRFKCIAGTSIGIKTPSIRSFILNRSSIGLYCKWKLSSNHVKGIKQIKLSIVFYLTMIQSRFVNINCRSKVLVLGLKDSDPRRLIPRKLMISNLKKLSNRFFQSELFLAINLLSGALKRPWESPCFQSSLCWC